MLDGIRQLQHAMTSETAMANADMATYNTSTNQARYRASQLETITRLITMNVFGNLICGALTVAVMFPTAPSEALIIWSGLLAFLMMPPLLAKYRRATSSPRQTASPRCVQRCTMHAIALSACWTLPTILFFSSSQPEQQTFLAAITAGMMCAGGFSLYPVRSAALYYTGILGVCAAFALLRSDLETRIWLLLLLLVYSVILTTIINNSYQVFRNKVFAGFRMEERNHVIELLLTNFQRSTTDVLWQLDSQLRIQNATPSLSDKLKRHIDQLNGQNFLTLIKAQQDGLPDDYTPSHDLGHHKLGEVFASNQAFHDQELPVGHNGQVCWWAITGQKIEDGSWVGCISDNTEKRNANREAWELAHKDSVTELLNRRAFNESVGSLLHSMERKPDDDTHAVLCIDLDRFKSVNDAFGHDSGDHLLKIVAARLSNHTRYTDVVARTGGDEFNILLRHISHDDARDIAQTMIHSLKQPCQIGCNSVLAGASIGLAMIPDNGTNVDTIRKNADLALYEAKKQGRGQLVSFCQKMAETAHQKNVLEQALRQALPQQELFLVYQPQQNLQGVMVSAEALLRWRSPSLGMVDTQTFINIAEDTGQIHALGDWVIEEACQLLSQTPELPCLAINASPLQLASPTFVDDIKSRITHYQLAPGRLELEITETVLLDDSHGAAKKLKELKAFGIRIALDDFGTGYSSLLYLKNFPFDKIKIDRSFVMELHQASSSLAIVESVINMAHAMNMEVVAEGVESASIQAMLQQIGCDAVQGYGISMPLSHDALIEYMKLDHRPRQIACH